MVIIVRRVRLWLLIRPSMFYSCLSIVHYSHYRDAFYPQLACCHDFLPQFTTSCNPYKPWTVSDTQCAGMEEALKCFAKDKGNQNNWPCPCCLEAFNPRGPYSNISYVRDLRIYDSSGCIGYSFSQDWNRRGMDHWAQHILYQPETLQIPFLNCSIDLPIHQWSQYSVKMFSLWRARDEELACETWYLYIYFVLVSPWFSILDTIISKIVDGGLYFIFSFYFHFTLLYFFFFLFLEQLGLGFISHAVISVTKWWRSHKTDHGTWEKEVEGSGTKWCHTAWTTYAGLM